MELRLGTFNVWGLPEPFADDVTSRMRAIARRLVDLDLDVLLIQEAWTEEVRDRLRKAGLRAGFEVAEAGDAPGGGLLALSRRPIRSSAFERFHFRGDPERVAKGEYLGGKGFQTLTLDGDGGPVTIINTHLHARYRRERPRLNSAVRMAQLLQIVGGVHRIDGPLLVGGDFNCVPGDPEYRVFAHLARLREVADDERLHPTITKANFYKRHRSGSDKRIDLLFVRGEPHEGLVARESRLLFAEPERIRGKDRSLSDHFGFQSKVRLSSVGFRVANLAAGRPDPQTFDLARGLLEVGQEEAARREEAHLRYAAFWVTGATVAAGLRRHPSLDRRSFLRGSAGALALFALAPAFGYTTLARFDADQKRDAFDDAHAVLGRLESRSGGTA